MTALASSLARAVRIGRALALIDQDADQPCRKGNGWRDGCAYETS